MHIIILQGGGGLGIQKIMSKRIALQRKGFSL